MSEPQTDAQARAQFQLNALGIGLTIFLCVMLAFIAYALIRGDVQATFRDVVVGLVGFITAKISTVFDYCFGTSSSSKKQTETIAQQADTAAKAQAALAPAITAAIVGQAAGNGNGAPIHSGDTVTVNATPATGDVSSPPPADGRTETNGASP